MLHLAVDPVHYAAASALIGHDVAGGLYAAFTQLDHDLRGTDAMAGHDSTGRSWAVQYDATASRVASGIEVVQRSALTIATLLQRTGFNHGTAETSSAVSHRVDVADTVDWSGAKQIMSTCGALPSAAGGSGDYPTGWTIIRDTVGYEWPDARTGRLRSAGEAWSRAGTAIAELTTAVDSAISSIRECRSSEVPDAVRVCTGLKTHLTTLAMGCQVLAAGARNFAHAVDTAHSHAIKAMEVLAIGTVATEAIGGVLSFLTLGAAEAPTQVVEAAEVTSIAARVRTLLAALAVDVAESVVSVAGLDGGLLDVVATAEAVAAADVVTVSTTVAQGVTESVAQAELRAAQSLSASAGTLTIDLRAQDAAGGHTQREHVGKSDDYLMRRRGRLASTFTDYPTACRETAGNIAHHSSEVDQWINSHPRPFDRNNRLILTSPVTSSEVGRVYDRRTGSWLPPTHVVTVLEMGDSGWYVLTSYPTNR